MHSILCGSQPSYALKLGLSRSPLLELASGSSEGGPVVRTQTHLPFSMPGVNIWRGTPTQSLCTPPLKEPLKKHEHSVCGVMLSLALPQNQNTPLRE